MQVYANVTVIIRVYKRLFVNLFVSMYTAKMSETDSSLKCAWVGTSGSLFVTVPLSPAMLLGNSVRMKRFHWKRAIVYRS